MRDFWKNAAFLASIGFSLGVAVGIGFLALFDYAAFYAQNDAGRLALYLFLCGALGGINMGAAALYSLEDWSILRATLTHLIIALAVYLAIGFSLGWLSFREPATLWMLVAYIAAYFLVWLAMYLSYKHKVRRLNATLRRWKARRKEG